MTRCLSRFSRDTRAAVTVEFVIIFPAVVLLILFILFASVLIATASDVQQLAFELARSAVGVEARRTTGDLCTALNAQMGQLAAQSVAQSVMLEASRVSASAACTVEAANTYVTVSVSYNVLNSTLAALGDNFDAQLGTITRTASSWIR